MRIAIVFAAAAALAGAATAAAPISSRRDWTQAVAPAPRGSFVIGNPAAKVKLVEYVSYTCPHCAHFNRDSAAVLKGQMIRSGSTSLEVRSLIANQIDLVAAAAARCVGPRAFPKFHDALFAGQEQWFAKGAAYVQANQAKFKALAPPAQMKAVADASGITALARTAGAPAAAMTACFRDTAAADAAIKVHEGANPAITGTPAFEINGTLVQGVTWEGLEPKLRAAGAR